MLHNTFSPESLQQIGMKEGEIPPHTAPKTDTHISDTNKIMKNDNYPWLYADNKRPHMTERSLNRKLILKDL